MEPINEVMEQAEKLKIVGDWCNAVNALAVAKEKEAELKKRAIAAFFVPVAAYEGNSFADLDDLYKLKLVQELSYSWVKDGAKNDIEVVTAALGALTGTNPNDLVTWSPSLKEAVYKKLNETDLAIMQNVVVTKDAAFKLEIVKRK